MSRLRKLVPAPVTSAALFVAWLALARSIGVGQVLLALALALVLPIVTSSLRPEDVHVRRPMVAVRYAALVAWDVLLSNLQVAWGVVTWRRQPARSRFVTIPLELRDPVGLAALAVVTTIVPGTVWSELAHDRSSLVLHVWDVGEEEPFIARFKDRYERPLREIFE